MVVFDNASTDGTRKILKDFKTRVRVILSDRNLGFAEGQNRAIRAGTADWVLTLNPDVLLEPWTSYTYVRRLNPRPARQDEAPECIERDNGLLADPFLRG